MSRTYMQNTCIKHNVPNNCATGVLALLHVFSMSLLLKIFLEVLYNSTIQCFEKLIQNPEPSLQNLLHLEIYHGYWSFTIAAQINYILSSFTMFVQAYHMLLISNSCQIGEHPGTVIHKSSSKWVAQSYNQSIISTYLVPIIISAQDQESLGLPPRLAQIHKEHWFCRVASTGIQLSDLPAYGGIKALSNSRAAGTVICKSFKWMSIWWFNWSIISSVLLVQYHTLEDQKRVSKLPPKHVQLHPKIISFVQSLPQPFHSLLCVSTLE